MFDRYIATTTYSVSIDLAVLEESLDKSFLDTLLKELHVDSLKLAHLYVDYVSNCLTFSTLQQSK